MCSDLFFSSYSEINYSLHRKQNQKRNYFASIEIQAVIASNQRINYTCTIKEIFANFINTNEISAGLAEKIAKKIQLDELLIFKARVMIVDWTYQQKYSGFQALISEKMFMTFLYHVQLTL
jgi:hypothetical protein